MPSNATQKGNISRNKTKKWYEKLGYQVANAEQAKFCFFGGKMRVFKKDMFGADLLAMSDKEIIFIQCKSREPRIAECKRAFAKYDFPPFAKKVVVSWAFRAREPRIIEI